MRVSLCTVALLAALACLGDRRRAAAAEAGYLDLPQGRTPLAEIGIYRIGYQHYGEAPVDMPTSWSGYFTDDAGIAFKPVVHDGRPSLLLHCPWRGGTGSVFVEYRLRLPKVSPLKLALGIAMRADITEKSDGVTFTVSVTRGDATDLCMSEHYTQSKPKDLEFDLGRYAGEAIILRLQTEPGPNKDPSFDFSRFVEPRLIAGKVGDMRSRLVAEMTGTKAYRVLREADLTELAGKRSTMILPSCKVEYRNSTTKNGDAYELLYEGDDCRVVYTYAPRSGSLDDLTASVDGGPSLRPSAGGGVFFEVDAKIVPPARSRLVLCDIVEGGDALAAVWRYEAGGLVATVRWLFAARGKALAVAAESNDTTIARFSLGRTAAEFRKRIQIPYLYFAAAEYLRTQKVFTMGYIDWTASKASESPGRESVYSKKTDGERNALQEIGYVAVSPDLAEVLPNIPHPPSPYLGLLGPKMVLDSWGGEFRDNARRLERYKACGIDELAIIEHVWQRYGYDVKLPDHLPPDPSSGGHEGMKVLAGTARRLGYTFSLHENYIDFYPDAPSWNPKDVVLDRSGEMSKAWYHPGTRVQSFAIKANRMLHYAEQNSPEIHRLYGTTASYLDVHTCVPPWHHVDYEAGQPKAGMHALKVESHAKLFAYERRAHEGPLFGEGWCHFFWAGLCDGVEAQIEGGEDVPVLVDFDLLKLHPQMVNHGMGYYSRWLRKGGETRRGVDWPTPLQLDKYRAQELAYGHAAFVGDWLVDIMPAVVREYNLTRPVQALYATAKATEISYEVEGRFVSSSVAAVAGVLERLRVRYDSGLTLHVNLGEDDWRVERRVLPQFGFLAEGPDTLVYTAKRDGAIVDFARTKDGLFVDSRADTYKPWVHGLKRIEPRVRDSTADASRSPTSGGSTMCSTKTSSASYISAGRTMKAA
jgi:hypothetical protein